MVIEKKLTREIQSLVDKHVRRTGYCIKSIELIGYYVKPIERGEKLKGVTRS